MPQTCEQVNWFKNFCVTSFFYLPNYFGPKLWPQTRQTC